MGEEQDEHTCNRFGWFCRKKYSVKYEELQRWEKSDEAKSRYQ